MLCELGPEASKQLKGAVVVLPAVTYANVGELAVDVLVATLKPEFLGAVESANVLPVVGNDAYDLDPSPSAQQPGGLATALELFKIHGRPLVFLQQRAPAMVGRQSAFAAELVSWLVEVGASALVVLTGLDAQLRRDRQLDSSQLRNCPFLLYHIRYLASNEELRTACTASAQSPKLQTSGPQQQQYPDEQESSQWQAAAGSAAAAAAAGPLELESEIREEELQLHHSLPPWPLVRQCEDQGLPYVLLGCFSAEGDNAGEGMSLAAAALRVLAALRVPAATETAVATTGPEELIEDDAVPLRAPSSWVGLYGRPFPVEIF
ncbi:hypothetical protein VOLCADRAFT_120700 [Volvox carteri f. nagariensis]|uniref:Proteasome assembly chaperone 2 n=1 Tax=Volvox carteri f. nagariensis TaxID=3068 RepID=D8TRK9_VOLCA|nr:uncharacterized protein VOLCADRAFT_120700 [Volvox carteri f. nagariensis]EFJ50012.1 hypothetical protein VOLCADRAFT_120700 [Volvox carteri f. nagariensis]|eukprot:XP_002949077.1 hypothetical protein VOLCADRAFT_120700 [Volvox carteri f. nagariensis]